MTQKEALTARMPPDTYGRVMDYREARDLTKSDAARRLIESGLDAESAQTRSEPQYVDVLISVATALLVAIIAFAVLAHGVLGGVVVMVAGGVGFTLAKILLMLDSRKEQSAPTPAEEVNT